MIFENIHIIVSGSMDKCGKFNFAMAFSFHNLVQIFSIVAKSRINFDVSLTLAFDLSFL